jgi:hypothetical protein
MSAYTPPIPSASRTVCRQVKRSPRMASSASVASGLSEKIIAAMEASMVRSEAK